MINLLIYYNFLLYTEFNISLDDLTVPAARTKEYKEIYDSAQHTANRSKVIIIYIFILLIINNSDSRIL